MTPVNYRPVDVLVVGAGNAAVNAALAAPEAGCTVAMLEAAPEAARDMGRLTGYRCAPDPTEVLIGGSYASAPWLKKHGVKFQPAPGRRAFTW